MAKFQAGQPRPEGSGRKKGSKNVKTLLSAAAQLTELGRHPIEELVKLADSAPDTSWGKEFKRGIWKDILPYCEAPQKEPAARSPMSPEESVANAERVAAHLAELSRPIEPAARPA